jgi:hypothetical protein
MLGLISTSKVPLRVAVFTGFAGAVLSFLIAFIYLVLKLAFWKTFSVGVAPMLIGIFFLMSIQMVFMGFIGEYVGSIYTKVQQRPYAIEQQRINFENGFLPPDSAT